PQRLGRSRQGRGDAASGGGKGLQAGRGDLRKVRDLARAERVHRHGQEAMMPTLTRRSVLRSSAGLVAAGTLARPYIANAQAKTAEVWWVQGFVQEEDISFKKIV